MCSNQNTPIYGGAGRGLLDHFGKPLSEIYRRDKEEFEKPRRKINEVCDLVTKLEQHGLLLSHQFVVISSNIFLETEGNSPTLLPAELALAKFSLKQGIPDPGEVFHVFPEPGPIPLGYKRQAMQASELGHKIPLAGLTVLPEAHKGCDMVKFETTPDQEVCTKLASFLGTTTKIFCPSETTAQCEGVLETLHRRAGLAPPALALLPLHALLRQLAPHCLPSMAAAEGHLEAERFLYCLALLCPWHAAHTDTHLCSAAAVRRMAYTLLDLACPQHGVQLAPGHHIPQDRQARPRPGPTVDWGEEEEQEIQPPHRNYFFTNHIPRVTGFPASDVRLRERRPAYPPPQELPPTCGSVGTISEFLGDQRDVLSEACHTGAGLCMKDSDSEDEMMDMTSLLGSQVGHSSRI